jgi:hypothetical protein
MRGDMVFCYLFLSFQDGGDIVKGELEQKPLTSRGSGLTSPFHLRFHWSAFCGIRKFLEREHSIRLARTCSEGGALCHGLRVIYDVCKDPWMVRTMSGCQAREEL